MQAVVIHEFGASRVLSVESLLLPEPGPGQARVKIEAAGLNFIDVYQRSGVYKIRLPAILGMEAAGTIDALGPEVPDLEPGDRVAFAMHRGAYAVMNEKWKYIRYDNGTEEFYDVTNDPNEWYNLAGDASYRPIINEMQKTAPEKLTPSNLH